MCTRLEAGDAVPSEPISELYDFLSTFGDRYHHGKEEKYLFPALLQEGFALKGGATDALVREHDMERKLISDLECAVDAYREDDGEFRAPFIKTACQYVDLMVEHFQKEDRAFSGFAYHWVNNPSAWSWIGERLWHCKSAADPVFLQEFKNGFLIGPLRTSLPSSEALRPASVAMTSVLGWAQPSSPFPLSLEQAAARAGL